MQEIQAAQYAYPYHYIPAADGPTYLSRRWGFAGSYVAAIELVGPLIQDLGRQRGDSFRHIDLGCGDGALLYHLKQRFDLAPSSLYGNDIDERAIGWARMFNPDCSFFLGDLSSVEGPFDSATLIEVLEHIPPAGLPDFLRSVSRVLAPGGSLLVTVPSTEKRVAEKHYQHFDTDQLRDILSPCFTDVSVHGFERNGRIVKTIERLRMHRKFHFEHVRLNRLAVSMLKKLHRTQQRCGRLFATCNKPR